MKILLDTHILIWALTNNPLLPEKAKKIIMDSDNEIYYSIVSLWEVEIKHLTNPKNLVVSSKVISAVAEVSGYTLIPLNPLSIYRLPELKRPDSAPRHKDPFDKILICEAMTEEMVFLTHDSLISDYGVSNVLVV